MNLAAEVEVFAALSKLAGKNSAAFAVMCAPMRSSEGVSAINDRILFLTRWAQPESPERWDNVLARPAELIDHGTYRVTYVCDAGGWPGIPDAAEGVHVVDDLTERKALAELVERLIVAGGPFAHVIALSEYLLDVAADLRQRFGIGGPTPAEVTRVRDKTVMKQILADAGVRVPRWSSGRSTDVVLAAAADLGYPVIFKPVRGASSQGVHRVESAADLRALCRMNDLAEYEVEEFVAGDVLHTDGVVDADGQARFLVTSRYLGNCLDFERGEPLGSVIVTEPGRIDECHRFARACLTALGLRRSAFHLEYFDTGQELVFLEVGARVAGADVPYVVHDVTGVNLFGLWLDVLLDRPLPLPREWPAGTDESGGWLMIPRPGGLPRTVVSATPLLGRVPYVYRELVPRPGDLLLDRPGSYASLQGGRFLLRGGTEGAIWDAVTRARLTYHLTTERTKEVSAHGIA